MDRSSSPPRVAPGGRSGVGQLALECLEEVFGVVFLDLDVLVARDPEGVVLQDVHAREEVVQMRGNDVFEGHEALCIDGDEAW